MDFELSEQQRAIKDTARAFAHDEMMPLARQWDEEEVFPADTLRQAAALGFGGIYVSADLGGSALSRLDAALIFEELAQGCPSTAAYISIHNMVAWMVDAYGADDLRQEGRDRDDAGDVSQLAHHAGSGAMAAVDAGVRISPAPSRIVSQSVRIRSHSWISTPCCSNRARICRRL